MKNILILVVLCSVLGGCLHHKHHKDRPVKSKTKKSTTLNIEPMNVPAPFSPMEEYLFKETIPPLEPIAPEPPKKNEGDSWIPWY